MTKKHSPAAADEIDLRILEMLQEDSKLGIQTIASKIGKGISTVHARVKSLEERGFIKKWCAVLNPDLLDRPTLALIFVTIRYRLPGKEDVLSQKQFCREISKHPYVQEVFVLGGQYDVFLKVRTKDTAEMNRFITEFLRELPAVDRTLTMFVMDNYLESLALGQLARQS